MANVLPIMILATARVLSILTFILWPAATYIFMHAPYQLHFQCMAFIVSFPLMFSSENLTHTVLHFFYKINSQMPRKKMPQQRKMSVRVLPLYFLSRNHHKASTSAAIAFTIHDNTLICLLNVCIRNALNYLSGKGRLLDWAIEPSCGKALSVHFWRKRINSVKEGFLPWKKI